MLAELSQPGSLLMYNNNRSADTCPWAKVTSVHTCQGKLSLNYIVIQTQSYGNLLQMFRLVIANHGDIYLG